MRGVAALMRCDAGFEVLGNCCLVGVDGGTDVCRVGLVGQVADRVADKVRVAEVAVAVDIGMAHRLDLVVHRLGRAKAQILEWVALQNIQHLADHDTARAWRWCRDDVVAAVITFNGRQFAGAVAVQVDLGEDAAACLAGFDDGRRHFAV